MAPMSTAAAGLTKAQGAVMATRPAKIPFMVIEKSGLPKRFQEMSMAVMPPTAAAKLVVKKMWLTKPGSATMPIVEPGLKPNQPNHKINTPSAAKVMLWPGMATALLFT